MIEVQMTGQRLSDGSTVYNVVVRQRVCRELAACRWGDDAGAREHDAETLVLPANSAGDADRLAAALVDLVNRHTAEQAKRTD